MQETIFDAPVPELAKYVEKPVPTLSDYRKWNKTMVTRQLPVTKICGHKLDPELGPNSNCIDCWMAFFNSNAERVEKFAELMRENKTSELEQFYGAKYVKKFKHFLIAVAELQREHGQ